MHFSSSARKQTPTNGFALACPWHQSLIYKGRLIFTPKCFFSFVCYLAVSSSGRGGGKERGKRGQRERSTSNDRLWFCQPRPCQLLYVPVHCTTCVHGMAPPLAQHVIDEIRLFPPEILRELGRHRRTVMSSIGVTALAKEASISRRHDCIHDD